MKNGGFSRHFFMRKLYKNMFVKKKFAVVLPGTK